MDALAIGGLRKAEVHVHLEGCFEVDDLVALAATHREQLPRPADRLFEFSSFDNFLDFLSWSCSLVRTRDEVHAAAYRYAERAGRSGVVVADIIVNPTHWHPWNGNLVGLVDALDAGFSDAEFDGLPPVGVCVSVLRQQSAAEALGLVDRLIEIAHPRVVALSIDGNEAVAGRTGARFADAFRRAGEAGFGRTVHAGESSGPEGVRDAIDVLGADRIDHGVRAIEDPALVHELADRRMPLGVCPSSNITLGIVPSLAEHPIDALRLAGVPVSVNTDDPAFLANDLVSEYAICAQMFSWSDEVITGLAQTSLDACFMAAQRGLSTGALLAGKRR